MGTARHIHDVRVRPAVIASRPGLICPPWLRGPPTFHNSAHQTIAFYGNWDVRNPLRAANGREPRDSLRCAPMGKLSASASRRQIDNTITAPYALALLFGVERFYANWGLQVGALDMPTAKPAHKITEASPQSPPVSINRTLPYCPLSVLSQS